MYEAFVNFFLQMLILLRVVSCLSMARVRNVLEWQKKGETTFGYWRELTWKNILGKLGREPVTDGGQAEFPNRSSRTESHFSQGVQSIADTVPDSSAVPDLAGLAGINEQWGHRLVAAK